LKAVIVQSLEENRGYYFGDGDDTDEYHSGDSGTSYLSQHFQPIKKAASSATTNTKIKAALNSRSLACKRPVDRFYLRYSMPTLKQVLRQNLVCLA
jgi:hypothetical protein